MHGEAGDPLAELSSLERFHFRLAGLMNREPWKAFWSACGRQINARGIAVLAGDHLRVSGFEHVEATSPDRPILLIANHRSYFDLYVVSSVLFRQLKRRLRIYYPVRGRYYYETLGGMFVNFAAAYWSMYPPLFSTSARQNFDRYALDLLIKLCSEGEGNVIGIHPEGTRNRDPDPYSFGKFQPGAGRIIHAARPQVLPAFITGLPNQIRTVLAARRRGADPIRVHFGQAVDLSEFYALPAKGSTYKAIVEHVMSRVAELAEADRATYGKSTR
jgi:1-acyl-sn-glycerol-3-phosphate acyltransferase